MKELKNPLFESLYGQIRSTPTTFGVYEEESGDSMKPEEVKKYFMEILNPLQLNIGSYLLGYPIAEEREEMVRKYVDLFPKLENNATLQDLINSLAEAWENLVISQVKKSPKKEILEPVYARVNAGVEELMRAFEELKKKAGDNINNKNVLESVNGEMKKMTERISSEIIKKQEEHITK